MIMLSSEHMTNSEMSPLFWDMVQNGNQSLIDDVH